MDMHTDAAFPGGKGTPRGAAELCYPRRFDAINLRVLGDPPFYDEEQARARYDARKSLEIAPIEVIEGPPPWHLTVSPSGYRYSLSFFSAHGTPLRDMTWEREGDLLVCRQVRDVFYPDGDPRGRVAYVHVLTATGRFSLDGIATVTLSGPRLESDEVWEAEGVPRDRFTSAVPGFDDLAAWVLPYAPDETGRYGADALPAARALAEAAAATGRGRTGVPAGRAAAVTERDVIRAVDALTSLGERSEAGAGVDVLERGQAIVMPLARQVDAADRDPSEESRRMSALADAIRDACEQREGRGIALDLDDVTDDSVGSYVSALREAGVTRATYWVWEADHGVVLAWAGDEAERSLSLALHVVPATWVSASRAEAPVEGIDVAWS